MNRSSSFISFLASRTSASKSQSPLKEAPSPANRADRSISSNSSACTLAFPGCCRPTAIVSQPCTASWCSIRLVPTNRPYEIEFRVKEGSRPGRNSDVDRVPWQAHQDLGLRKRHPFRFPQKNDAARPHTSMGPYTISLFRYPPTTSPTKSSCP